jgi:primary-amine oxidase
LIREKMGTLQSLTIAALLLVTVNAERCASAHPLDPLSAAEIRAVVAVLQSDGSADSATRYALIDIDEPVKPDVLAWEPGQPFARRAFVIARRHRTVYEGVVDLSAQRVERWQAIPNVESAILDEEVKNARQITTADPRWQDAMRKRGFNNFSEVFCAPLSAGYSADPDEEGRRLVKVTCFAGPLSEANVWSRPIEGLLAIVDLDERKVIRLIDKDSAPVAGKPPNLGDKSPSTQRSESRPMREEDTRQQHNFIVIGNEVQWNNWSFHYRMDERVGLILSLLRYDYDGRKRMVLYRGSVAEMFAPYMDPDSGWSFRTYVDVGEFGLGPMSSPLMLGIDCPADAAFFDAILPNERGRPVRRGSVICMFERNTGGPLWRHFETANGSYQGRPGVELVLRTIPSIGNYDYIIDWVLTQTGTIRIDVGATGIDQVKGVRATPRPAPILLMAIWSHPIWLVPITTISCRSGSISTSTESKTR